MSIQIDTYRDESIAPRAGHRATTLPGLTGHHTRVCTWLNPLSRMRSSTDKSNRTPGGTVSRSSLFFEHIHQTASNARARLLKLTILLSLLLAPALWLQGCATLSPSFEPPEVQVTALEPLPNNHSGDLRFRIHLRVFNPNDSDLGLSGLYYTLKLAGHKVITGTSSNLPVIPAYGQEAIVVDAAANLMGSFMAAAELIQMQGNTVPYELEAKLGLQRSILPAIRVTKRGEIPLGQYQR